MKNFSLIKVVLCFAIVLATNFLVLGQGWNQNVSPLPPSTGMINDFANVIEDTAQEQLEQKLKEFRDKTNPSVEIAVVTVKTTEGRPIFDYSLAVARGWKIGSKDDENPSALILIAIDDRKYFTQISRDLEDELPDGKVGQIQRQYLVPSLKQANYTKAVSETVNAFITAIEEKSSTTSVAEDKTTQEKQSKGGLPFICLVLICLIVLFIFLMLIFSRRKKGNGSSNNDRWRGGGFGGGTGKTDWSVPIIIGGWGGSSGSSDWGSSSGESDSWGGFGGGGDFGGGGAGGDW